MKIVAADAALGAVLRAHQRVYVQVCADSIGEKI
jgi:hypothetical protein